MILHHRIYGWHKSGLHNSYTAVTRLFGKMIQHIESIDVVLHRWVIYILIQLLSPEVTTMRCLLNYIFSRFPDHQMSKSMVSDLPALYSIDMSICTCNFVLIIWFSWLLLNKYNHNNHSTSIRWWVVISTDQSCHDNIMLIHFYTMPSNHYLYLCKWVTCSWVFHHQVASPITVHVYSSTSSIGWKKIIWV